ncbi:DUF3817 domain-containing protein [Pseudalkalibacillus decolorationis]|uniref:DUF3817 domain-containing protein n=1 Tax=Pseudalkalibacillus decolorationis TaxID=163879 RepID=UPI00214807AC|nr:DUF3817 domain-containing protein [Pseudalkalibacillus decolorationis]
MKNPLSIFKVVGYAEGISFLVLLGIAMPLKYMFDYPLAVTIVGALHGGLFVLYVMMVIYLKFSYNWSVKKAILGMIASVIPFGPFIFDAKLVQNEA